MTPFSECGKIIGMKLTERQQTVLAFIESYASQMGHAPTMKEIAKAIGVATPTVQEMILRLKLLGLVKQIPGSPRTLVVIPRERSA